MGSYIQMIEIPLKPCPLCGDPAVMESVTTALEKEPRYRVRCTTCGLGCLHWDLWSVVDAANWWNRRTEEHKT